MISLPTSDLELNLKNKGYKRIVGVDEVGRGALCGPVVSAAVHIPDGFDTTGINDSKKVSSKKRDLFYNIIINECLYSIKEVDNNLIDAINIREATKLAMKSCIEDLVFKGADFAIIDGNFAPEFVSIPTQCVIRGDALSISIAAASIVAKVWRDHLMEALHVFYPMYNWNKNKGYGTSDHLEAIKIYGVTKHHRKSFGGVKEHLGG